MADLDSTSTSRLRLLQFGKVLFARHGYEQTSTAALAREAGTSESQLIRYYKSKAGLLEAVFNDCWAPLNAEIQQRVVAATNVREALMTVLDCVIQAFSRDHDAAYLLLFEGRRIRGSGSEIALSRGFTNFDNLLRILIGRGKRDGTFDPLLNDNALAAALLGATESMVRERLMAQRTHADDPFTNAEISAVFTAILDGLARR